MRDRQADIEEILRNIDISPTMFRNAVSKYDAVSDYLNGRDGINAEFYPQGSFKLGTVVRPYINGTETDYDLDVVCELNIRKGDTTAQCVKKAIGNALSESEVYSALLKDEDNRCWTLEYAKVQGDIGFRLDIVPSVHQDEATISALIMAGVDSDKANCAISITNKTGSSYHWLNSNPNGYCSWFDGTNSRFKSVARDAYRKRLFGSNRHVYASIEDVPELLERTALQQVVQILKRHRDVYYTNARQWDRRPISAIITTLSARIASHAKASFGTYELLKFVVEDLRVYSNLLSGESVGTYDNLEARSYIRKEHQKWLIQNPVDPGDNYADCWDTVTAQLFFQWVAAVFDDFIDISSYDELRYFAGLKRGFGGRLVDEVFSQARDTIGAVAVTGTKPWSVSLNR